MRRRAKPGVWRLTATCIGVACGVIACSPVQAKDSAPTLSVIVSGLRNANGLLRVALFRSAVGYPEESSQAARTASLTIRSGSLRAQFSGVPAGMWALAVLHDENGNGKLDRSLLGIPVEGVGASNDAANRLGPPRFEDARFELPPDGAQVHIVVRYWL